VKNITTKKAKKYKHLTHAEREEIAIGLNDGLTLKEIAKKIDRDVSTVSREIRRNQPVRNKVDYRAHLSQKRYDDRKRLAHQRERISNKKIQKYIIEKLKLLWSPEIIAGRISIDMPGLHIGYEAIYQWIYNDRPDLIQYLLRKHKRRRCKGSARGKRQTKIPNRIHISKRSASANNRKELGHWEADTAVSRQSNAAIMAAVERKSRYLVISKLKAKTAVNMHKALVKTLKRFDKGMCKSITYDNGSENTLHEETNKALGTNSYFCTPYHSWEKGSVENRIGKVRGFHSKKTDWALVSTKQLRKVESLINNRPMKSLAFKTPKERLRILMDKEL
jgi:IS30 family transposase